MKKLFAIFAIAGLMATASCGNKEVTEETTETMESTEVVEETIEVVEETADSSAVIVEEVVEEVK
jgi:ketopantoate reductase